jgi:hypothetical protein
MVRTKIPQWVINARTAHEVKSVTSASSRRWHELCWRRRIESALSRRAIIVPELLVSEINEGADHEREG